MLKKLTVIIFIAIILAINLAIIYPYLFQDFPRFISSIEVGFITMGRWFAERLGGEWWIPEWYSGIPIHLLYAPLAPLLTAIFGSLLKNFGLGYHLVSGIAYILVPVSLFFFIRKLTKSDFAGLVGAIIFSLAPSFGMIFPQIRSGAIDHISLWRLIILVYYGEGPHTLSQVFLILSGLFSLKSLEQNKFTNILLASVFMALTALSNPIGLFIGLVLLLIIFFSWGLWKSDWKKAIITFFKVSILGLLLSSFWYNPSFILNEIAGEGGQVGMGLFQYFPWRFLVFFTFAVTLSIVLKKLIQEIETGIAVTWFCGMFILLGSYYIFDVTLVPQIVRFVVEFDMAGATLLAIIIVKLAKVISEKWHTPVKATEIIFGIILIIGSIGLGWGVIKNGNSFIKLGSYNKNVTLNILHEYRLTNWLKENADPQDRIFVSANYTFWLNYFSDVWQLRGSHFQASINPWEPHAGYQITAGEDGDVSLLWAKIYNLRYIVVNPANSYIFYQDYVYPDKFRNILPVVGSVYEDEIYEVKDLPGLASTVNLDAVNNITKPINGADGVALQKYVDWISQGQKVEVQELKKDKYLLKTALKSGEGIRIAFSFDKGWKAKGEQGNKVDIVKDPLGFMLLKPNANNSEITISYFPPISVWIGWLIFIATFIFLLIYVLKNIFFQKSLK